VVTAKLTILLVTTALSASLATLIALSTILLVDTILSAKLPFKFPIKLFAIISPLLL